MATTFYENIETVTPRVNPDRQREVKFPLAARFAMIVGASLALWLAIVAAVIEIIA